MTITLALVAAVGIGASILLLTLAIALPGSSRIPLSRRRPDLPAEPGLLTSSADVVNGLMGRMLLGQIRFGLLELAGLRLRPADLVIRVAVVAGAVLLLSAVAGRAWIGVLLLLASPLVTWLVLQTLVSRRRAAFAGQLDDTLQLLSGSLRAGHSLVSGLSFVAAEADEPAATELTRTVNEARMGRDLSDALTETARRMASVDFGWVAQAIAINREVGGNLAEVLERTAVTVRERAALGRQVKALSAEGRMSVLILMALPVVVAGGLSFISPAYIGGLVTHPVGWAMIGVSSIMFLVGGIWMRAVTQVKV